MKSNRAWYLICTKPRQEQLAEDNLNRQGYPTYLPRIQTRHRRNGRYQLSTEAFFPRYLFIHLDDENDNWAPIRSTIGVSGMVRFGGIPAVVPDIVIESLRDNEDDNGLQEIEYKELKTGDSVNIVAGPFEGYKAIYQDMKSTERVSVLLNIVGSNTRLTLSMHELDIV